MNQAVCKFCGQAIMTEVPENATRAECEHIGAMECGCEAARNYQKWYERAAKAKIELDVMLSKTDEDSGIAAVPMQVVESLKAAIDLIADDLIHKIDIGLTLGGKVDIKSGTGGKISIKRSVTQSQKSEVE